MLSRLLLSFARFPRLIRWSVFLGVFFLSALTLLRFGTYLFSHYGRMPLEQAAAAFGLGLRYDLRIVAGALLAVLALGALPPLHPFKSLRARRFWFILLTAFGAALVVFYAADFIHYRYLHQRLNASALGFLRDAQISAGMAWQTYPIGRIALGMIAAVAALTTGIVRLHRRADAGASADELGRAGRITAFASAILLCLVGMFGRIGQFPLRWSDAFGLRDDASAHLALNPVQSFFSSLSFRASTYDAAQVRAHAERMRAYLGAAVADDSERLTFERRVPARTGAAARPNVVLVICESFSGYKSSMWGNPLDPSPFFATLCRDGVFFDNCFTPHFGTARGVWATITGIPDVEPTKTASRNPALVDQHTIINEFTGYEKLYFLGGSSSWANIRGLLTNNIEGLRLYEEDSFKSRRVDTWGVSDTSLFLETNDVLRAQTKPFFAIIQTAGNHRPYTIPEEDLDEFARIELSAAELKQGGFESNDEFNAFRYSDFAFRKFIEAARKESYFENTIFVFIGDHGIGGDAGTMFPTAWTEQGLTAFHVPLLLYAPKLLPPQRVHSVASMVDLLPTVAGAAGISYRNTGLGRDLLRQQQIDGGRSNVAFVIDQHNRSIGVVHGAYYGSHQREGGRESLAWADFAAPPPAARAAPELLADYKQWSEAFHETARYLLFNNQKRPAPAAATTTASTFRHAPRP
ncbi:MAG TPA: LTA synthase family protein [Opitutaceae bacterium]